MKFDFAKNSKTEIEEGILSVLKGEKDSLEISNIPPYCFETALENAGADLKEDLDFNGWQCDYQGKCTFNDKTFTYRGSAWYGRAYLGESDE